MPLRILYRTGGKVVGWIALVGLWFVLIQGAWTATQTLWPGLHEDGSYYSTIPINLASGLGNTYSVHARALHSANTPEPHRDHGQLYAPLISYLMKDNSFKSLLSAIHWVNFASLILAVFFYFLQTRRLFNSTNLFSLWVATGFSTATVGTMHYLQGRPEHGMVAFLLVAGLLGEIRWKSTWPGWFHGMVIGVSASFSPLPGVLWAIGTTIVLCSQENQPGRLLKAILTRCLYGVGCWVVLNLLFSAGSITQIILNTLQRGLLIQSKNYLPKSTGLFFFLDWTIHWFSPYWISLSYAPGLLFPFALAFLIALVIIVRLLFIPQKLIIRIVILILSIALLQQIFSSSIEKPGAHYNLLPLLPGLFSWILDRVSILKKIDSIQAIIERKDLLESCHQTRLQIHPIIYQRLLPALLLIFCSIPALGFIRVSILQSSIKSQGVSFVAVCKRYQELKGTLESNEFILIDEISHANSKSAVIFDEPPWKTVAYNEDIEKLEKRLSIKIRYFFDLQERSPNPEEMKGYRLIESNFNQKPAIWNGLTIRYVTPGYGYAIYEKMDTSSFQ
jgi:hypothetical protein